MPKIQCDSYLIVFFIIKMDDLQKINGVLLDNAYRQIVYLQLLILNIETYGDETL